ncbi:glycosyl transferase family 1 [Lachnoclostridium sp. An131]|uniref:glycosyltransferase n=1 Tax=Lachnoclostridium sp. An131 TaxID=1965555 RepID=UPI000B37229F|nr:glycosyltransferase [Lachnoclostridium sp. An131]OUQ23469.1 glycosyl transferase family 1 [Lachnoclostridium sp. An131]
MKIYIYKGGFSIVKRSGVGSAVCHQEQMLRMTGAPLTDSWRNADVVHINTVFPDSALAAYVAGRQKKRVVYYGHSTMEDFRNSFIGSNFAAPYFKKWLCFCYGMGDLVLTPTEYSRRILEGYGIKKPLYAITNGVDTDFFRPDAEAGKRFRRKYGIPEGRKAVISAGHLIRRKGIFDFLQIASEMPDTMFVWFGGGSWWAVPRDVKRAVRRKPENVIFAGYVDRRELKDAYCGADAFLFCSQEETEGIVVLEALSCKVPVIVRRIPVYDGWLRENIHVFKAENAEEFRARLDMVCSGRCRDLTAAGRRLAEEHSLFLTGMRLNEIYQMEELS